MIECRHPRCCECGHPIAPTDVDPGPRWTRHCCVFCRTQMQVRSTATGYAVRSSVEAMRLAVSPLPLVAPPALRDRFFGACRSVAALLGAGHPVEPGMANVGERSDG